MRIFAVMPVRGREDLTQRTLQRLAGEDLAGVLIFDNDDEKTAAGFADENVDVVPAAGLNIHEMWNWGWSIAVEYDADHVWFVNNDIDFCPGTARHLAEAFTCGAAAIYPDYSRRVEQGLIPGRVRRTSGTYRVGGLCGWCFMVRAGLKQRFDESFGWWYGDDDFVRQIEAAGGWTGRLQGVPVDHLHEATAQHFPALHAQKQQDAERYTAKWAAA